MKILIEIGFDYLRRHLLSRLQYSLPKFASFIALVFNFGEDTIDVYTDENPNNKAQMETLFEGKCVELVSAFCSSIISLVKSAGIRQKIAAILRDTANQLAAAE